MNKGILLAVLMLLISSPVMADGYYAGISAQHRNGLDGNQDNKAYGIVVGQSINKYFDGEIAARLKTRDDNTNNTRVEGALVGKLPINDWLSAYARGAVGEKFDGTDNNGFWSVEPGVKVAVTSLVSTKAGVRFRDGFTPEDKDSTRTYRFGVDYALTKNSAFGLNMDIQRGDTNQNHFGVDYKVKF